MSGVGRAYLQCEEMGIDTEVPDALDRLWAELDDAGRREFFPYATF